MSISLCVVLNEHNVFQNNDEKKKKENNRKKISRNSKKRITKDKEFFFLDQVSGSRDILLVEDRRDHEETDF